MPSRFLAWNAATQPRFPFALGGWVRVYNTTATIRQGAKTDTDATVLKSKLSLNWTAPYAVFAVGPYNLDDTPDGSPLGSKLLYLDLPSDMPGANAHRHVSVQRCKSCANLHDHSDMPKYLPAGLTQCAQQFLQKNPTRTPSLKTMFRLLFKDSK